MQVKPSESEMLGSAPSFSSRCAFSEFFCKTASMSGVYFMEWVQALMKLPRSTSIFTTYGLLLLAAWCSRVHPFMN